MQQHSANKILIQINVKYTYDIIIFKTALDLHYYHSILQCRLRPSAQRCDGLCSQQIPFTFVFIFRETSRNFRQNRCENR